MSSPYRNNSSKKPRRRKPSEKMKDVKPAGDSRNTRMQSYLNKTCTEKYGTVCWLCGHGGASSADHVIPYAEDEGLRWEVTNTRPAHSQASRCQVCEDAAKALGHGFPAGNCQSVRGALSAEAGRRKIEKRTGLSFGSTDSSPGFKDDGRDW